MERTSFLLTTRDARYERATSARRSPRGRAESGVNDLEVLLPEKDAFRLRGWDLFQMREGGAGGEDRRDLTRATTPWRVFH